jgi:hypothetical protein
MIKHSSRKNHWGKVHFSERVLFDDKSFYIDDKAKPFTFTTQTFGRARKFHHSLGQYYKSYESMSPSLQTPSLWKWKAT